MDDLISKLSSYNILNYLFPGVLFVVLLNKTTDLNLIQESLFEGVFLYYFIGMLINRFGSLVIEPIMKKIVVFEAPERFKQASKIDPKIDIYSETNNMFRSIASVLLLLLAFILLDKFNALILWHIWWVKLLIIAVFFVTLVLSYKKQCETIVSRIKIALNSESKS